MKSKVRYKSSVSRDLRKIDRSDAIRILEVIESDLAANPEAQPALAGRFAGLRRYRVGDFRVIYALAEGEILVLRIAHRKDVYRK